jgi:hypothetical protein
MERLVELRARISRHLKVYPADVQMILPYEAVPVSGAFLTILSMAAEGRKGSGVAFA